jgi:hypothetical protein
MVGWMVGVSGEILLRAAKLPGFYGSLSVEVLEEHHYLGLWSFLCILL